MRSFRTSATIAAGALGLLLAGAAVAEEPASEDERYGRNLNNKQKAEFGQGTVNKLDDDVSKLQQMIDAAESANDVIKLNCLSSEISKLEALQAPANTANQGLVSAIASENRDLIEFNFNKLYVSRDQASQAFSAAEACVGKTGGVPGQTNVVVRVQGDGGGSDASDFGSASNSSTVPPDATPDGT